MQNHTRFQEKVIRNYYNNRDEIAIQRLQELASDLYLSEGKKRVQLWKHVNTHLSALKVPQKQIDHIISSDKPELLATTLKTLMKKQQ
ncbi:MAG: hypothetical protein AB7F89_02390 [Pirellulaceae bacterium]